MPSAINAMFAIQGPEGLTFGYVYEITLERLVFEIDSRLGVGMEVEWRMELKGYPETAMGRLSVESVRRGEKGMGLFAGRITYLPPADHQLLIGWIKDVEDGGTSRRIERNPEVYVQGLLVEKKSDVSTEERMAAIERINARQVWAKQFKKKKGGFFGDEDTDDPLGIKSEGEGGETDDDFDPNDAILAALMENVDEIGDDPLLDEYGEQVEEPAFDEGEWAPPGVDLELARALSAATEWLQGGSSGEIVRAAPGAIGPLQFETPVVPSPPPLQVVEPPMPALGPANTVPEPASLAPEPVKAAPEPPPPSPPSPPVVEPPAPAPPRPAVPLAPIIRVDRSAKPVSVRIAYADPESFKAEYTANLKNKGCSVPGEGLPLWTPLAVTLELPSGTTLQVKGEVVGAAGPLAFVSLKLGDAEKKALAREAS